MVYHIMTIVTIIIIITTRRHVLFVVGKLATTNEVDRLQSIDPFPFNAACRSLLLVLALVLSLAYAQPPSNSSLHFFPYLSYVVHLSGNNIGIVDNWPDVPQMCGRTHTHTHKHTQTHSHHQTRTRIKPMRTVMCQCVCMCVHYGTIHVRQIRLDGLHGACHTIIIIIIIPG